MKRTIRESTRLLLLLTAGILLGIKALANTPLSAGKAASKPAVTAPDIRNSDYCWKPGFITGRSGTAPDLTVTAVNASGSIHTSASTINYVVTFSAAVTGVTRDVFSLTTTGITGASISSVSGSGTIYFVTVNTGIGDGSLRLNVNGTGISPAPVNTPYLQGQVYTIDRTPPAISLRINGGAALTASTSFQLSETASDADPLLQMRFSKDGLAWGPYAAFTSIVPAYLVDAGDGPKEVYMQVIDQALNIGVTSASITLDQTPPTVAFNSGPLNPTNNPSATFTFVTTEPVSEYTGSLDAGPYAPITAPYTVTGVSEGNHSFSVRAKDLAGNLGVAGFYTWRVDLTPPQISNITIPAGTYHIGQPILLTATMSETVNNSHTGGTDVPYININVGGAVQKALYVSGEGSDSWQFQYTVQEGDVDGNGIDVTPTLYPNGNRLTDVVGNVINTTVSAVSSTSSVLVNGVRPSVTWTAPAKSNAAEISIQVDFSEAVSGVSMSSFQLSGVTGASIRAVSTGIGAATSSYTVIIGVPANTKGLLHITLPADQATGSTSGNTNNNASTDIDYDNTPPVVLGVSAPSNGYYKAGQTLDFLVDYNKDVVVNTTNGGFHLPVTIGTTTVQASYVGSTGPARLHFAYTVQAGDNDDDGIEVAPALVSTGGTLLDTYGNGPIDYNLANLPVTNQVLVNTVIPTVTLSSTAQPAVNRPFPITAVFSEAVYNLTTAGFHVTNGIVSGLQTTDNITYTAMVLPLVSDSVFVEVAAGAAQNIGGNGNTASAKIGRVGDYTPPAVIQVTAPADNVYHAGESLDFQVIFSEKVLVNNSSNAPYIAINMNSGVIPAVYISGDGTNILTFRYTVQNGDDAPGGISLGAGISLGGSSLIFDFATNNALLPLNNVATTTGVKVNTTIPTVRLNPVPPLVNGAFIVTASFSEVVTGLTASDFNVTNGVPAALTTLDNITYTITITPLAEGAIAISLPVGAALNIGRNGSAPSNVLILQADLTAPAITQFNGPADGRYKAGDPLTFTVQYSEDVTVTGAPRIGITMGGNTVYADYQSGSGSNTLTFVYTIQPGDADPDGITLANAIDANGGAIKDDAGNSAASTLPVINATQVLVNTTIPTVTLSTTPTLVNAPFTVTATFSEAVSGLTAAAFTMVNGTASNLQTADNITYTVTITPVANGTVSVTLPAGSAENIGLNGNTVSNTLSVQADLTAPAITQFNGPADGHYKAGDPLTFTVQYSEDVTVTGAPRIGITMGGNTVYAAYQSGSGSNTLTFVYTIQPGDADPDGITLANAIDANGGTVKDDAGNSAASTLPVINATQVLVNTTIPTVTLSTTPTLVNAPFTVMAIFSEAVTGLTAAAFTMVNGTASNLQTTDHITYTVTITPVANGTVSVTLPAGSVENIGLNGNTVSNTLSVQADLTAPAITQFNGPADGRYKAGDPLTFTVQYSEDVTVTGAPRIGIAIGGNTVYADYQSGSGSNTLTFVYTIQPGDADPDGITLANAIDANGGTVKDDAGNSAASTLPVINATQVLVNTTIPTVTLSTTPTLVNAPFTVTATFSEAVSGLTAAAFTMVNGTVSNLLTIDNITYTVTITPAANGMVSVTLPAGSAENIGLNGNTVSNTLSVQADLTAPAITQFNGPADGRYKAGDPLTFTVQYSEDVTVTGAPRIGITMGGNTVYADYQSGSGSNTLTFVYTIQPGDADPDGITLANAIDANGGTVKDDAGNSAASPLPVINATQVLVNTTIPTVTLSTTPTLVNAPFTVMATFSEAVSGLTAAAFTVVNGTASNLQTTDHITYTVTITPAANGTVSVTLPAGSAENIGLNGNTVSNTLNVQADLTAPAITQFNGPADGRYKAGDPLTFTVQYSEDVTVTGAPRIGITMGGNTVYADYQSGSGSNTLTFVYTIQPGDADPDGITLANAIDANGGTVKDDAGNSAASTLPVINATQVLVNTTIPTVTLSTTPTLVNAPFTVTATFSEVVSGLTAAAFTVVNGTAANLQTADHITYTVAITPAADGTVSVTLPASSAQNTGLNGNTVSNTLSVQADLAAPSIIQFNVPADGRYKAGDLLTFTVQYSEAVTVTGAPINGLRAKPYSKAVTVTGVPRIGITMGSGTVYANYQSGSGSNTLTFTYTIQPGDADLDGITLANAIDANGGAIKDDAGNSAASPLPVIATSGILMNTIAPVITQVNVPVNGYYNAGKPLNFTVIFDQDVTVTGTPSLPVIIDGNTVQANYVSGSGTRQLIFTYTVQNGDQGTSGIALGGGLELNGGTIQDAFTNDAARTLHNTGNITGVVINTTTPTVTLSATPTLVNASFTVTAAFSEAVTGLTAAAFTVVNGTASNLQAADNITYTVTILPAVDGTVSVTLPAASAQNIGLNGNTASNALRIQADMTAPVINAGQLFTVQEYSVVGASVGTVAATETTGTLQQWALISDPSGAFAMDATTGAVTVKDAAQLDKQVNNTVELKVTVSDGLNTSVAQTVNVQVTYVALPPSDILLDNAAVSEGAPAGTLVGGLSAITTAPDPVFTYTLVSGTGADDNASFTILGNELRTNVTFVYAVKQNYTVRVRATQADGAYTEKAFSIAILQINQAPTLDVIADQQACDITTAQTIQLTGASPVEAGQTLRYAVKADQPYFSMLAIDQDGLLTYSLKPAVSGAVNITITLHDNGGTANGGVDTLQRSFLLTIQPLPVVSITADRDTMIAAGIPMNLTATGGVSYSWANAPGITGGRQSAVLQIQTVQTTVYTVTATNAAGCADSAGLRINIVDDFKVDATNVLTPNGDGKNDKWVIHELDSYPHNEVTVFDRSGRVVFHAVNYSNNWDGTYNGQPLAVDTYYYLLKFEGTKKTAKGFITIIR